MRSRYANLSFYSWTLATLAMLWLASASGDWRSLPPVEIVLLCVAACLFVFQFGVPAPRVGLISMERVPQIGLLLVLPAWQAAAMCGLASLIWPLLNRRYSQGSHKVALLRGVHNSAMTIIMLLAASQTYAALAGRWPLRDLQWNDIAPLAALALTAQVVNIALMTLFFRLDGREVRQIITPSYALSDLIFVPAGVLAAVLFNNAPRATFGLYVGLVFVFVLSFHALGAAAAQHEQTPLARVFRSRTALRGARTLEGLADRVLLELRALFRFDRFDFALVDSQRAELDLQTIEGDSKTRGAVLREQLGLLAWSIERSRPALIEDWSRAAEALRATADPAQRAAGSLMVVPLLTQGAALGAIAMSNTRPRAYSAADLHVLQRLAEDIAAAVDDARAFEDAEDYRARLEQRVAERTQELEKANHEKERLIAALRERSLALERETKEDPLTGLANRRHFMQRLLAEFEVAQAVGQPLTLAIADLDHFKVVNDRLGHRVGDEVLKQSAVLLRDLCGPSDLIARIGGEEFALLLPGSACDAAIRLCENARRAIEMHPWQRVHPDLKVTVSIGLWQWDGQSSTSELLHAADMQLYEAKRGGRNRVA